VGGAELVAYLMREQIDAEHIAAEHGTCRDTHALAGAADGSDAAGVAGVSAGLIVEQMADVVVVRADHAVQVGLVLGLHIRLRSRVGVRRGIGIHLGWAGHDQQAHGQIILEYLIDAIHGRDGSREGQQ